MSLNLLAASLWQCRTLAQQSKIPLIGYLAPVPPTATPDALQSFRDELRQRGYVEGQNIRIEYRWAAQMNKSVAAELVALNPDVIVAFGTPSASAARQATTKIPIVMVGIADPIGAGLISSLSRPGGNVTGTTSLARDLGGKLLEILREVVPNINPVFLLLNPQNPGSSLQLGDIEAVARALDLQLVRVEAEGPDEIDVAFARMTRERRRAGGLCVWRQELGALPRIRRLQAQIAKSTGCLLGEPPGACGRWLGRI